MVFNFRKIASVLASAVMVGSTVAVAAAEIYPAPFVKSGNADIAVVIGSRAQPTDMVALNDITIGLQEALAAQTATVTGVAGTGATATGGDSIFLSTSSRVLRFKDALNVARPTLSSTELPNVLADGKVTDLRGTEYSYSQTVTPASQIISAFGNSGGDIDDPLLYIDVGTSASSTPLYNYTLTFTNRNLNVSDATNVQSQKIKIMGVEYVIGASSTNTTLYLNGAGQTLSLNGGDTANFTIGGVSHTVSLITTGSATTAKIVVDGVSRDVTESSSYSFAGGLNIYIKDVTHPAFAGDIRSVELIVGANTLKLANGQTAKYGSDETSIRGSYVNIKASNTGEISGFGVSIAAAKTQTDHIPVGGSFVDPVFGGLKLQFAGVTPGLNVSTRPRIVVDTDNNQYARLKFTDALSNKEQSFSYVYDNNTLSTAVSPVLAHQALGSNDKGKIIVYEGAAAREGDWIVINNGDYGGILEVSELTSGANDAEAKVTFRDVFNDKTLDALSLTNSTTGTHKRTGVTLLGASGYTVSANGPDPTTVNITWSAGGARTLFPRIKLKEGGWISLLTETSVSNHTSLILPDGLTTLATTGESGRGNETYSEIVNGINWTYVLGGAETTQKIVGLGNPVCNFSVQKGPAILYIENKKWDDTSFGNYICVPMTTTGSTEIAIADPVFNGSASSFVTYNSDTYMKSALDVYGAFVTKEDRTNENGGVTILTPGSQMSLDVLFGAETIVVTPSISSVTSGTVKSLGTPTVSDTQAASLTNKNLIVIGGSCVNSIAAQLLGSTTPVCGADFTTKTGVEDGQFIIKTYSWGTGKVATLVAGFNGADTTNAATYLRTQTSFDIAAGKGVKGTTATTATPLVEQTTTPTTTA